MWLEAIEQAIEDGWPQLYVDLLPDGVRVDVALMHTPEQPKPSCGMSTGKRIDGVITVPPVLSRCSGWPKAKVAWRSCC